MIAAFKEIDKVLPLFPLQQGMMLDSLHAPAGAGVNVEQVLCRLEESLDIERFRGAWQEVSRRQSALRTTFQDTGEVQAFQRIQERLDLPVHTEDWRTLEPREAESRLQEFLRQDRTDSFQFEGGPLHRIAVFQMPEERGAIVWTVHHAITDHCGIALAVAEAFRLYDGETLGQVRSEEALLIFQGQLEAAAAEQRHQEFFEKYLKGFSQATRLPLPPLLPADPKVFGAIEAAVELASVEALKALARAHGLGLASIGHAVLGLLLARYAREEDIGFYFKESLRHRDERLNGSAGLFVNTQFMRLQVDQEKTLLEWVREVQNQHVQLREVELCPIAEVAARAPIAPGESLSEVYFIFEAHPFDALVKSHPGAWTGRHFELYERPAAALSIALYAGDKPELKILFDGDRFSPGAMERLAGHFLQILRSFQVSPELPLKQVNLLTPEEEQLLLDTWQPLLAPPPEDTLQALVERAAARNPDKTALQQGDRLVSFKELIISAEAIAARLRSLGVRPDEPVGIMVPRSIEMVSGILGILQAGGAYLPLDAGLPPDRVQFMLDDAAAKITVTVAAQRDFQGFQGRQLLIVDEESEALEQVVAGGQIQAGPDNIAYIIYTSGSTGTPKGVAISHRAACTFILSAIDVYGFQSTDRLLQFASLSFDASVEEIFATLASGATLVLRNDIMLGSAQLFLEQCERWNISILDLTTAYWHFLADAIAETPLPSSVRLVLMGGEAMRADKWLEWRRNAPPDVPVLNVYGPTEATVAVTWCDARTLHGPEVSIGKGFPQVQAYVLDPDLLPVPVGVPGELCVAGPQLAEGYLNREELTAKAFPPHPFEPGARIYRTGDRVRWGEDGELYYLGRIDRQVKVRGFRIELGEIESVLERHPEVLEAVVVTGEDALGNQRLSAYLTLRGGAGVEAVQGWLKEQLPVYMQPATWTVLAAMPMTNSGKIDRKALPKPQQAAAPKAPANESPLDELEQRLAKLWSEVLRVRVTRRADNFFELGGHSLLTFVLLTQVERKFGQRLTPIRVYQAPTLGAFAALLRGDSPVNDSQSLHPIQTGGALRPLFFVGSTDLLPAVLPTLGSDQPVYSLNLFGLLPEDGPLPDVTVPQVARHFVQELRAIQPQGPYALGGYCRDAMVALEMALQLRDAGEAVDFLLMLDVFWGAPQQHSWLRRHLRNLKEFGPGYVMDKLQRRRRWLFERTQRMKSFRAAKTLQPAALPQEFRNALFVNTFYDHCDRYVPKAFDGRITVILASEWGVSDAPQLAQLAKGGLDFREVRAFHQNLWHGEQALALGECIRDSMNTARAAAQS